MSNPIPHASFLAQRRAVEASELLLDDFRDRLNPEQYARALRLRRRPLSVIHPEHARAILRLYRDIAGERT